ncbi:hypothetical protein GC173_11340 [bacterium]|nr:hypothetical protein [bacterium]
MRTMTAALFALLSLWILSGDVDAQANWPPIWTKEVRLDTDGNGVYTAITETGAGMLYQPVTLSEDAQGLLRLSGQALDLATSHVVVSRPVNIQAGTYGEGLVVEVDGGIGTSTTGATGIVASAVDENGWGLYAVNGSDGEPPRGALIRGLVVSADANPAVLPDDGGTIVADHVMAVAKLTAPGLTLGAVSPVSIQVNGRPDFSAVDIPSIEIGTTAPFTVKRDGDTIATLGASGLSLVTALPITSGGTGATSASAARTALGLGTISTQASDAVAITGGTITTSGAGSRISATSTNSTAAVAMFNYSGGPAASFATSGAAPFTVNAVTKVTNLNSDLLDGIDSAALMPRQLPVIAEGSFTPPLSLSASQSGTIAFIGDKHCTLPNPGPSLAGVWYLIVANTSGAEVETGSGYIYDPGGSFNSVQVYTPSGPGSLMLVCDGGSFWYALAITGTWADS